jgi:phosphoribosylamine--glycine ligase
MLRKGGGSMNIVVVGSGFREHALVKSCLKSRWVDRVVASPGNAGIAAEAECVLAPDVGALTELAKGLDALVLIGPEAPLAAGWADHLRQEGIKVLGPAARAAELETSKASAKALMRRIGVPTAAAHVVGSVGEARRVLEEWRGPVVVKADGLAGGKGVSVASTPAEGLEAVRDLMERRRYGAAGDRVLLEERLYGRELSAMAVTDGRRLCWLPSAQDHKRLSDGDVGPNTGGMGSVAPHRDWTDALREDLADRVFMPVLDALRSEGRPFAGVLYAGIMLTDDGPKVLEWNVRLGDPEAAVALAILDDDPVPHWWGAAVGELPATPLRWSGAAVAVVMAAPGYPERSQAGGVVAYGTAPGAEVLHAGTHRRADGTIESGGGRTLAALARAADADAARRQAYAQVRRVKFSGMLVRTDIAAEYSHS